MIKAWKKPLEAADSRSKNYFESLLFNSGTKPRDSSLLKKKKKEKKKMKIKKSRINASDICHQFTELALMVVAWLAMPSATYHHCRSEAWCGE